MHCPPKNSRTKPLILTNGILIFFSGNANSRVDHFFILFQDHEFLYFILANYILSHNRCIRLRLHARSWASAYCSVCLADLADWKVLDIVGGCLITIFRSRIKELHGSFYSLFIFTGKFYIKFFFLIETIKFAGIAACLNELMVMSKRTGESYIPNVWIKGNCKLQTIKIIDCRYLNELRHVWFIFAFSVSCDRKGLFHIPKFRKCWTNCRC